MAANVLTWGNWSLNAAALALVNVDTGDALDLSVIVDTRRFAVACAELAARYSGEDLADGVSALMAILNPVESMVGRPGPLKRHELAVVVLRAAVRAQRKRPRAVIPRGAVLADMLELDARRRKAHRKAR